MQGSKCKIGPESYKAIKVLPMGFRKLVSFEGLSITESLLPEWYPEAADLEQWTRPDKTDIWRLSSMHIKLSEGEKN